MSFLQTASKMDILRKIDLDHIDWHDILKNSQRGLIGSFPRDKIFITVTETPKKRKLNIVLKIGIDILNGLQIDISKTSRDCMNVALAPDNDMVMKLWKDESRENFRVLWTNSSNYRGLQFKWFGDTKLPLCKNIDIPYEIRASKVTNIKQLLIHL
jgi:hypothetical protein